MRSRALLVAVALAGCKGNLPVAQGNDYPCDFSQPERVRDTVCSPGEVCGVDNRCRFFQFEGPQFEGAPSLPDYQQGQLLHPLVFDRAVRAVAAESSGSHELLAVVGPEATGSTVRVKLAPGLQVTASATTVPGQLRELAWQARADGTADVVVVTGATAAATTSTQLLVRDGPSLALRDAMGQVISDGQKLRAGARGLSVVRAALSGLPPFRLGEFALPVPLLPSLRLDDVVPVVTGSDGGTLTAEVVEARYLQSPGTGNREQLLVLSPQGFFLRSRPGGTDTWTQLSSDGAAGFAGLEVAAPRGISLRHDSSGSVWAFTRPSAVDLEQRVLSTWSLSRAGVPGMARAWADCTPCNHGRILSFAPRLDGPPTVEVLCSGGDGAQLLEVVGSAAPDESQECLTRSVAAAFPLTEINRTQPTNDVVEDESVSGQVLMGGRHGQIWGGESFSTAYPLLLDRTPRAFGTLQLEDRSVVPVALTDRYAAAPLTPGIGFQSFNVQRLADVPLGSDVVVRAMAGLAQGWLVLSTGDLAVLQARPDAGPTDPRLRMTFGPRLVDARGAPAREPFFAEGVRDFADGGLVSLVMAADDSLYLVPTPVPTSSPETLPPATPQLTPEPGSPVRSFALERSTVGTDGITKVRGYVVTSRSLFTVQLAGTPARWSATPVLLSGGEPVETWMDHPLGGLGRVGYRDGQVFTLPGGFLLVNELPRSDGGVPAQVLDYENLAGWPVALATTGLFVGEYGLTADGHLDNKFADGALGKAMHWREVSLPDGGRPWLGETARLQVLLERTVVSAADGGGAGQVNEFFGLLVYTDEQVFRVAQLVRPCSNCTALSQ